MIKITKNKKIPTGAALKKNLTEYISFCREASPPRLPNVAGFCRYCDIRRSDFYAMREKFPLEFDIAESAFIDEAINIKAANSSTAMAFLRELLSPDDGQTFLVCEHDAFNDGQ